MYDLIIIGSGPAGYSASIYAARGNLKTLMIAGFEIGGQLCITDSVENYPGFIRGELKTESKAFHGQILMDLMYKQAKELGVEIIAKNATKVDFSDAKSNPSKHTTKKVYINEEKYEAKSIIICTGATAKKMNVTGFDEFFNHGVSMCATCDGMIFKGKEVIVVGGGNTAVEEAIFLSKICKKVTLIHRRDELRAEKMLQNTMFKKENIQVLWNTELHEIKGQDGKVTHVILKTKNNLKNQNKEKESIRDNEKQENIISSMIESKTPSDAKTFYEYQTSAVFIAIGHTPNTGIFQEYIDCDDQGYINTNNVETSIKGVYAAGDVIDRVYKQAITAAGEGCKAALDVISYLQ